MKTWLSARKALTYIVWILVNAYAFTIYLRIDQEDLQYKILGSLRRFIMKDRNTDEVQDLGITPGSIFYFSDDIVRDSQGNYYTVSGEFLLNVRDASNWSICKLK